jgi:hypothetical protein
VTTFRELKKEDVVFPGKGDDEGEGFRVISWIWLENGKTGAVDSEAGQEEINERTCVPLLIHLNCLLRFLYFRSSS